MRLGDFHHLKPHSNLNPAFISRTAQHSEAGLELDALVDSAIADQHVPWLMWILVCGVWVDIRHCATGATRNDIYIESVPVSTGYGG